MPIFTTKAEAETTYKRVKDEWWKAYWDRELGPNNEQTKLLNEIMRAVEDTFLEEYGKINPRHPECKSCLHQSLFGGPDHDASPNCRSGRRPHCSCDTCF